MYTKYSHTLANTSHPGPPPPLTLADVFVLLEAWFANTSPDGNEPASVGATVHLWSLKLLGGVHTHTVDLHQRRVATRYCVRKLGQVEHSEGALLVKNPHGDQSNAGTQVLEGQVKALFTQVADVPHLGV